MKRSKTTSDLSSLQVAAPHRTLGRKAYTVPVISTFDEPSPRQPPKRVTFSAIITSEFVSPIPALPGAGWRRPNKIQREELKTPSSPLHCNPGSPPPLTRSITRPWHQQRHPRSFNFDFPTISSTEDDETVICLSPPFPACLSPSGSDSDPDSCIQHECESSLDETEDDLLEARLDKLTMDQHEHSESSLSDITITQPSSPVDFSNSASFSVQTQPFTPPSRHNNPGLTRRKSDLDLAQITQTELTEDWAHLIDPAELPSPVHHAVSRGVEDPVITAKELGSDTEESLRRHESPAE